MVPVPLHQTAALGYMKERKSSELPSVHRPMHCIRARKHEFHVGVASGNARYQNPLKQLRRLWVLLGSWKAYMSFKT